MAQARSLIADRGRALSLTPVSRETIDRLDRFVELLLLWQSKINLVASSTLDELWTRHIADSLQLVPLAPAALRWLDLGSGAGFPGLVIACALADRAGAQVHLVESNAKKATFLSEVARTLALPTLVHRQRIADFAAVFSESVDVVTARALAPLNELIGLAEPFMSKGAQGLFLKGKKVEEELTIAAKYWRLEIVLIPSRTHAGSRVVQLKRAERSRQRIGN